MTARCSFHVLNRADPADSQTLYPETPTSGLILEHPPAVGDLIWLSGVIYQTDEEGEEEREEVDGCWRVLARSWSPAVYGSRSWPALTGRQTDAVSLDLMVEPAEGLFAPSNWPTEDGQR